MARNEVKRSEGPLRVDEVRFTPATAEERSRGHLGYVRFVVNGRLRFDVALRRTADGRHALSFPAKRDSRGRLRHLAHPVDDATRRDLEEQVFRALGLKQEADG